MWKDFIELASNWSNEAVIIRLILAVVFGIAIGSGRTIKRRSAGMKTHTLVCLGSTVVMLTGQYIYFNYPGEMDMTRMSAQVVSGVGFLGVGTILVTGRNQIKGLTTAAGLWVCACYGLALGVGFVDMAIYALVLALFTLKLLTKLERYVLRNIKYFDLYLEFKDNKSVARFMEILKKQNVRIDNFELGKKQEGGVDLLLSIEVFDKELRETFVSYLIDLEMVEFVEEL